MKNITAALGLCLLSAFPAWSMSTLDIKEGETYLVTASQQRLSLSSLSIADGAKVVFAESVKQWHVRAERASIGNDVTIEGSGAAGITAANGDRGAAVASCRDGNDGSDGATGSSGAAGVSIRMQLGLESFGDLRIISDGGNGGVGGNGGNGSPAGGFGKSCKSGPKGGNAGAGGTGGDAGMAGDISFLYWPASGTLDVSKVVNLVQVSAKSGAKGQGGQAGQPGNGSDGRYVSKRTLTGNRAWVGGGKSGVSAQQGASGQSSVAGRVLVEQALVSAPSLSVNNTKAVKHSTSKGSRKQEMQAIKQELRALLQRLDELEMSE